MGFRDLQWRRKRFFIAVLATALLFAVTLLLSGISAFFDNEVDRTMRELDVDTWVVPSGTVGPFTSASLFPATQAKTIAEIPGITRADPILFYRKTVNDPKAKAVNIIGYEPGGIGQPRVTDGRLPQVPDEMVVDRSFERGIGDTITVGGQVFRVVGTVKGITYLGGTAAAFISITDAQRILLDGAPLAMAIVARGDPKGPLPKGYTTLSSQAVRSDLARPVASAGQTIAFLNILLWIIAAGIVAAILFMSALERVREFAVIKAMGAGNRFVVAGLASQAIVLSLSAAVVAFVLARLIAPMCPLPVEIPTVAYIELVLVSVTVGLVGSLAGVRRVLSVDPAVAFGGA